MILTNEKGIKTPLFYSNEILRESDANFIGKSVYQNLTDVFASLCNDGSNADTIISGLSLTWSSGLVCTLKAGSAISFSGSYFDEDDEWGFSAAVGEVFLVLLPKDVSLTFDAGDTSNPRIDIVEIRPIETEYATTSRLFKDPLTGTKSSMSVATRKSYDYEVQIVKGTAAASPTAPSKTAGWIKLCEVYVATGATSISQSNIKNAIDSVLWVTEASITKINVSYPSSNPRNIPDNVSLRGFTTEERYFNIGYGRTGNGISTINLIGDATYTSYGLQIRRLGGSNGESQIIHKGTGTLRLHVNEAGSITFYTSNTLRTTIASDGRLTHAGSITATGANYILGTGTFSYPSTPTYSSYSTIVLKGSAADAILTMNDGSGNINFRHLCYMYSDYSDKYQLASTGCLRIWSSNGSFNILHGAGSTAGSTVSYTTSVAIDNTGIVRIRDDQDATTYIGRAAVGYHGVHSDYASFSHRDQVGNTGTYALLQASGGTTILNCASGTAIYFRVNNTSYMGMWSSGLVTVSSIGNTLTAYDTFNVLYNNSTINVPGMSINTTGSQSVLGFRINGTLGGYIRGDNGGNLCFVATAGVYLGYSGENWGIHIAASTGYVDAPGVYNQASLSGRYVGVTSAGALYSVTSSIKYKKDVEDIADENIDKVLNLRPVWFRSTNKLDKPDWSWYGLIAEEVAEIEPRLVQYKENKDGTFEPEGVAYLSLPVLLLGAFKKDKLDKERQLKEQAARIQLLEEKLSLFIGEGR